MFKLNLKIIYFSEKQSLQSNSSVDSSANGVNNNTSECLVCSQRPRDTLLKPCNHVIGCEACSARCKRCLICKRDITERVRIGGECEICSERSASVMLEPCGHVSTCETCTPMIKKCLKCRVPVQRARGFDELCGVQPDAASSVIDRAIANDVVKLKQELQGLKEQVRLKKNYKLFRLLF